MSSAGTANTPGKGKIKQLTALAIRVTYKRHQCKFDPSPRRLFDFSSDLLRLIRLTFELDQQCKFGKGRRRKRKAISRAAARRMRRRWHQ